MMQYQFTRAFAQQMDRKDPLRSFRDQFFFPRVGEKEAIYFCGNSLGLQPRSAQAYIQRELDQWAQKAVDGHFEGDLPWFSVHQRSKAALAEIVGANQHEVVAMNSLTVNLHLLMASFYQPTSQRFKIITEAGAFPSDMYMLESQVKFHGYEPEEAIIELHPRSGEHCLRTEDILQEIATHAGELALVMMSGVQYYTGQAFDMEEITKAGHKAGAKVGFDLAHAVGNVSLDLHDWGADFAAWCSYKYLNSGPGNVAGLFVHERHADRPDLKRFSGWWGHEEKERFKMEKGFKPMYGADGWQLSNGNVLAMAAHQAALDIYLEAGMQNCRRKSELLTGYLEFLIRQINAEIGVLEIITPDAPQQRGCQLSLLVHKGGKAVFDELHHQGIVGDWRHPNVIRVAPTPLYNQFEEVYQFAVLLKHSLRKFT